MSCYTPKSYTIFSVNKTIKKKDERKNVRLSGSLGYDLEATREGIVPLESYFWKRSHIGKSREAAVGKRKSVSLELKEQRVCLAVLRGDQGLETG
jgi:hypothetical protein